MKLSKSARTRPGDRCVASQGLRFRVVRRAQPFAIFNAGDSLRMNQMAECKGQGLKTSNKPYRAVPYTGLACRLITYRPIVKPARLHFARAARALAGVLFIQLVVRSFASLT